MKTDIDIDFGGGRLLDLYRPDGPGPWPLIAWSHGSGWLADNGRDGAGLVAEIAVPAGFAVAGVAIRSSAQARFPAQRDDIADALGHLVGHAGTWAIDGSRIVTMGESSGGWVAAMAALTTDLVAGAVVFYPPTDFLTMDGQMPPGAIAEFAAFPGAPHGHDDPESPESRLIGGPIREHPAAARAASPVFAVHAGAPPFLIMHGGADRIVPHGQGAQLAAALAGAGVPVDFYTLPHAAHAVWRSWLVDPALQADATLAQGVDGTLVERGRRDPSWRSILDFARAVTARQQ